MGEGGGGCTLNHAVHHIDMLCWMMGLPQTVTSVMANVAHDNAEVEDLSLSVLQYPGALAQLTASVVHHGEEQELVFQCEKAKVAAPFSVYASISKPNGFPIENTELEQKIRDFVDAQPQLPTKGTRANWKTSSPRWRTTPCPQLAARMAAGRLS